MYALILAGGKGERLRPLTDTLPKPMVQVRGKPILEHQVAWLKSGGVTDVVFLAGYRWEAIKDHFGDGKAFGVNAHYSVEDSPLGRGGAIKAGFPKVPGNEETVAVLNGDIITAETLDNLSAYHRERRSANPSHLATIMVVPMVSPYGLVDMDESGTVTGFREKVEMEHWINAGIYLFERSIAAELPDLGDHETETFPRLAKAGRLAAMRSRSFWRSVDSFKDLREAEEHVGSW
ncbi:MAG: nucleotidyltransferase family protein [Chloroflexi bacterium]|nr:nucleotidyltransferase family protein [Chloroflexota bacterium]MCI0788972.1 nucleotidyltransferase family protein [Chloroflexota bacterium]MCI0800657.1 nucleotidyltransferase family protein [Chloroflexota bacterium]MCI0810163.1 nucleotidyltransferase family protein [Chloroflexota bacterium]MCI0828632.1 nucleotidyltransferase family protein [Chloroflexota bacterium]